MELLEVIEDIRADVASPGRLFGDAGVGVRAAAKQKEQGRYQQALQEASRIVANALKGGRRDRFILEEAMTTSDFPLLMGDILDRSLLANYKAFEPTWPNYCKRSTVRAGS